MTTRVTVLCGTRPEAIKMAPVLRELRARQGRFQTTLLSTGQHRDMLSQALSAFDMEADEDLGVMREGSPMSAMTATLVTALSSFFVRRSTDLLLVQGDTTSAFAGGLVAFHHKIKVGHVEAGLRSQDMAQPFPEEANRRLLSVLTDYHFAPSETARDNLIRENIDPAGIFVTGNTGIDSVLHVADQERGLTSPELRDLEDDVPLILVTAHRRENLGEPIIGICEGLRRLAAARQELRFVFTMHPNPEVRDTVRAQLEGLARFLLTGPLPYPDFVTLMARSKLIISDSGGVQEEAPPLGVPVLVMRNVTERVEALQAGTILLVGTDPERICGEAVRLLEDEAAYRCMATRRNPYGDGHAARRIVDVIEERCG